LLPLAMTFTACESDTITVESPSQGIQGIQVTGSGSAFGEPDVAVLSLGVSVEKPSVKEARDVAAEAMQEVLNSLKNDGVTGKDIQTQQFSIYPMFNYLPDGRQELRGFQVTNIVLAKVRNLEKIGEIIDRVVDAGGNFVLVQSIQFTIDDPKELQAQARVKAIQDAQAKAKALAEQSGVKLGKLVSIFENIGLPMPRFTGEAAAVTADTTPIERGQLEIQATVTMLYEIE